MRAARLDLGDRLQALEAHLGVARLPPEFQRPQPDVIPLPGGGVVVAVVDADNPDDEPEVLSGDPETADVVIEIRRFQDSDAGPAPEANPASLDLGTVMREAQTCPRDDANAPGQGIARPEAVEAPERPSGVLPGAIRAASEPSWGRTGWHVHSFGADGRCTVAADCTFVSRLWLENEAERRRQEHELDMLRTKLALEVVQLAQDDEDEGPMPAGPLGMPS